MAKEPLSNTAKALRWFIFLALIVGFGLQYIIPHTPLPEAAPAATPEQPPYPYEAVFTCGMTASQHMSILNCLHNWEIDTTLELTNGSDYGLYKAYTVKSVGTEDRDGFHIPLRAAFAIKAQNANDRLILGLKIINSKTGEVMFQKQVAQYGVIAVKNGD